MSLYVGSYEALYAEDNHKAFFCSMCGCIHTKPHEDAGDTHSLNYIERYERDGITRGLFSCSWVMCT